LRLTPVRGARARAVACGLFNALLVVWAGKVSGRRHRSCRHKSSAGSGPSSTRPIPRSARSRSSARHPWGATGLAASTKTMAPQTRWPPSLLSAVVMPLGIMHGASADCFYRAANQTESPRWCPARVEGRPQKGGPTMSRNTPDRMISVERRCASDEQICRRRALYRSVGNPDVPLHD
jgi:hypothetical protein